MSLRMPSTSSGQLIGSFLKVLHELHAQRVVHTDLNRDNLLAFGRGGPKSAVALLARAPDAKAHHALLPAPYHR